MRSAYVALVIATGSWGVSVTLSDLALTTLSPADLLLAEVGFGTAGVGLLVLIRRLIRGSATLSAGPPAPWRSALFLGLLEPGATYLFAIAGLALTTATAGSLLLSLESVFAVTLTWVFLRERLRPIEAVAVALGFVGAAGVGLAPGGGDTSLRGNVLLILAALTAALYFLASRTRAVGVDPLNLVLKQGVGALIIAVPFAAYSWTVDGSGLPHATTRTWLLAVTAGVVAFTIPFVLWSIAVPVVRASVAAVALNLIPLLGVASAAAFGRGVPSPVQLAGGATILLGLGLLTRVELATAETEVSTPDRYQVG